MSLHVVFDPGKCQGYANCLIEAPEIWDFDEDTDTAVLRQADPPEAVRAKAEAAARCCPAQAITLEERAG
ncbi:ferredoxin [Amycolatopsis rhabdoformis]|uniref:Ferredoxin n=1 Tax=Amycolatopsis rhabdoformis TaxID=1448059 RepID=A0ABZ1IE32_9PSEU|nr:ferredoxin [Amycolatopsis rhabdoformis]WSE31943.1 ferredoxin [Amycolatopsis rhabdoformis]